MGKIAAVLLLLAAAATAGCNGGGSAAGGPQAALGAGAVNTLNVSHIELAKRHATAVLVVLDRVEGHNWRVSGLPGLETARSRAGNLSILVLLGNGDLDLEVVLGAREAYLSSPGLPTLASYTVIAAR
ncbi:MAG: hypothetical protein R3F55_02870 [Alphaproteobacteria bacterium]